MDTDNLSSRKLKRLHHSHMRDAELNEVFLVLSVGASLIATLGLLANSTAVVIGAMVVAPWITPLRAAAFAILLGEVRLLGRSLRTLLVGVSTTTLLSLILGLAARLPQFGTEVLTRTAPNLLDLGIALVAGGLATYAKLRSDAVSSMAGTAIAVALVPPICVMGLLLSHQRWSEAYGAGLLFTTNLLGILTGGLVLMAWKDRQFRHVLRRSHLSAASFLLTGLLLIPLGSSFVSLLGQARKDNTRDIVQGTIKRFLTRETLTFGDPESVDVERVDIAWDQNPPVILVVVRVADSNRPTFKEVSMVQEEINRRQPIRFRLLVQRTAVDVVGPEEKPNENSPEVRQLLSPPPVIEAPAVEPTSARTEEGAKGNDDSLSIQDASASKLGEKDLSDQTFQPAPDTESTLP
ncbi:DUF389 domain-containing protein [Synechococcus sp. NOUM97013]|uniref:DUF389 domain-containing protein n=1 Tax=Synechococcus sp. NOUM97013 TaxID=1442555 RepID=UPI001648B776|nr:DUF389 domain-containing protein [Synechococcus sp. NOUM97013]QNI74479.1 conserved hypothetical protein (DUF389) [Synechococcus sp. NOUM97013]